MLKSSNFKNKKTQISSILFMGKVYPYKADDNSSFCKIKMWRKKINLLQENSSHHLSRFTHENTSLVKEISITF